MIYLLQDICVIACPVRNVGPSRDKRRGEKVHQFQTFYVDVSLVFHYAFQELLFDILFICNSFISFKLYTKSTVDDGITFRVISLF